MRGLWIFGTSGVIIPHGTLEMSGGLRPTVANDASPDHALATCRAATYIATPTAAASAKGLLQRIAAWDAAHAALRSSNGCMKKELGKLS